MQRRSSGIWVAVCGLFAGIALAGCGAGGTTNPSVYQPIWMHYRGDVENHGQAPASGAAGNIKWTFQTGNSIFSTAAIGRTGIIYVTSLDGYLYALNPNGSLLFKFKAGAGIEEAGPGIAPDGSIVFGADDHNIYDVDPYNGSLRWKFATTGIIFSSPAFEADGTVIIGSYFVNPGVADSGPYDGHVYAINLSTGKQKWAFQAASAVGSSAAIGPDGTIYVGSDDDYMYALNSNGTLKWKYNTGGIVESSPDLYNGTLYFGSKNFNFYALNAQTGALKWSFPTGSDVVSSPAMSLDGSTIYFGSWDHNVYALNAATGTEDWAFPTGDLGDASPVVGTDGTIFYASNDGHVYAINPSGSQKWALGTNPIIYTSVSVDKSGTIYEGTLTGLFYAID